MSDRPRPTLPGYLGGSLVVNGAIHTTVALLLSALAVSRAESHVLSPAALAVVVTLATLGTVAFAWPSALYGGAYDALHNAVSLDLVNRDDESTDGKDALLGRRSWLDGSRWAAAATVWAAAATALVVVALNEQRARWIVIFATWTVVAGGASLAVDAIARRQGVLAALRPIAAEPAPLRRRAWRDIALPLAVVQGAVNMVVAWVLFHDYGPDREPLTDEVAVADALVLIVLLGAIFAFVARRWGAVDAMLGRVRVDDPDTQRVSATAPLGRQGIVYVGIAMLFAARLVEIALPPSPSLLAVIVARGIYSGLLVYLVAGVAYVRGALNAGVPR